MKFKIILATAAALTMAACGQKEGAAPTEAPAEPTAPAAVDAPTTPTTVAGTITVEDAWCRPTPNGAKAGGCYVILTASESDSLKGVRFDGADMAQVHEMKHEDGMMKMAHLADGLPLPKGQRTELKPHGNHIMLMGLKAPLVAGQTAKITLDFDKAEDVTVDFQIRTPPVVGGEE
ncbi:copper chaperone PCu(A)C [uncultured Brevundimonas sp.]|uniref:copper chaperone PCu(A)C n=1 Tax=uncultured Brevundimonas sp. TaxID=213418 RepID=UPI002604B7B7|nr:copper chaperone PCu(A)C [uncultured Brevundimonas sp.]